MDELRINISDTDEGPEGGYVEAAGEEEAGSTMNMEELLKQMLDLGASDIFIVAGLPMTYEADGKQYRQSGKPMMPADTAASTAWRAATSAPSWNRTTTTTTSRSPCPGWEGSASTCSASAARSGQSSA